MGLFNSNEFSNVIEWTGSDDSVIFWKWHNSEIKKGSRLVIRPGQDAIFLYNGKIEGIFTEEGNYEVESQIIPFLSTLKGFKFGFNSGIRAEVLFVNTKEFTVKWGTRNAVNIPSPALKGGLPVRAFGLFQVKVSDYIRLIDAVAGVKDKFTVDDVRDRMVSILDELLMKWISKEGKDLFHLQSSASEIARGMNTDLDMELMKFGMTSTELRISSFSYPEEIQKKINEAAGYGMLDMDAYQRGKLADSLDNPNSGAGGAAGMGFGMAAGMQMAKEMFASTQAAPAQTTPAAGGAHCPNCGAAVKEGDKFCAGCGQKLETASFCPECGAKVGGADKFCNSCGKPLQ